MTRARQHNYCINYCIGIYRVSGTAKTAKQHPKRPFPPLAICECLCLCLCSSAHAVGGPSIHAHDATNKHPPLISIGARLEGITPHHTEGGREVERYGATQSSGHAGVSRVHHCLQCYLPFDAPLVWFIAALLFYGHGLR